MLLASAFIWTIPSIPAELYDIWFVWNDWIWPSISLSCSVMVQICSSTLERGEIDIPLRHWPLRLLVLSNKFLGPQKFRTTKGYLKACCDWYYQPIDTSLYLSFNANILLIVTTHRMEQFKFFLLNISFNFIRLFPPLFLFFASWGYQILSVWLNCKNHSMVSIFCIQ